MRLTLALTGAVLLVGLVLPVHAQVAVESIVAGHAAIAPLAAQQTAPTPGAGGVGIGFSDAAPELGPLHFGVDGQAIFADVSLDPGPVAIRDPRAFVGFYVAAVPDQKSDRHRNVAVGASSGETVSAWTAAVVFGSPPITRNPIDQWVAIAYAMGPRRRY